jgi:hypothetical protein
MLLIRPPTAKEPKAYSRAMHRIPPGEKVGKDGEADLTSLFVRLGIDRVAQEMVEQEVTEE